MRKAFPKIYVTLKDLSKNAMDEAMNGVILPGSS
jgi:hypothetical protein